MAPPTDDRRPDGRAEAKPNPSQLQPTKVTPADTIHKTITRPGVVKINVEGAFLVDESPPTPVLASIDAENGGPRPTQDIRLPHHMAVVSHVAVDVSHSLTPSLSRG